MGERARGRERDSRDKPLGPGLQNISFPRFSVDLGAPLACPCTEAWRPALLRPLPCQQLPVSGCQSRKGASTHANNRIGRSVNPKQHLVKRLSSHYPGRCIMSGARGPCSQQRENHRRSADIGCLNRRSTALKQKLQITRGINCRRFITSLACGSVKSGFYRCSGVPWRLPRLI